MATRRWSPSSDGEDGAEHVVGFGSLSPFRPRPAYATTVENSVYLLADYQGRGIGRMVLEELLRLAESHGFHSVIARIAGEQRRVDRAARRVRVRARGHRTRGRPQVRPLARRGGDAAVCSNGPRKGRKARRRRASGPGWIRTNVGFPAVLQTAPFGHSGTDPGGHSTQPDYWLALCGRIRPVRREPLACRRERRASESLASERASAAQVPCAAARERVSAACLRSTWSPSSTCRKSATRSTRRSERSARASTSRTPARSIELGEKSIELHTESDARLKALTQVLEEKLVRRQVSLKALSYGKVEEAAKGTVRQTVTLNMGISSDKAREIGKFLEGPRPQGCATPGPGRPAARHGQEARRPPGGDPGACATTTSRSRCSSPTSATSPASPLTSGTAPLPGRARGGPARSRCRGSCPAKRAARRGPRHGSAP